MTGYDFLFYLLAFATLVSGVSVVLLTNPIYSALSLVSTMIGLTCMYVLLEAYFIAGVQLIVYAGAVTVLFVMVLMLFDLKSEAKAFSSGVASNVIKIASGGLLCGLLAGAIYNSYGYFKSDVPAQTLTPMESTKTLAHLLFVQYLWAFEILGVLLLVVAVGVVAVSRIRGGTHAKS